MRERAIQSYRDLRVWQQAMELVVDCYGVTRNFPKSELYGLVSQIQRAAVSIPANIAEGKGRTHLGDYLRHLSIAHGSLMELETHLLIAERLSYVNPDKVNALLKQTDEISRMLSTLKQKLSQNKSP
jgi:four helix bundle protein